MKLSNYFSNYLLDLNQAVSSADLSKLMDIARCVRAVQKIEKKIIIVGNGGSAAIAAHLAVDFTKSAGVRAMTFNEPSLLTCFGNDYGYEHWVAKAIEAYADPGDLVILMSSSGKSPNILNGAKQAKALGLATVTLSGFSPDNPLRDIGDVHLWVDSIVYNVVETTHQAWLLAVVDYLCECDGTVA